MQACGTLPDMSPSPQFNNSYLSRRHTKKDHLQSIAEGLSGYLNFQQEQAQTQSQFTSNPQFTNLQLAMELYQETHASEASQHEALSAFKVFCDNLNAQIFTSIKDKNLQSEWLQEQMEELHIQQQQQL